MRSGGSVRQGVDHETRAPRGTAPGAVGLDRDPVRAGDLDEQGRHVRGIDVEEERDARVEQMELERPARGDPVAASQRVDRDPVEREEVPRIALPDGVDALEPVQVPVHRRDEAVDERVREGLPLDRVEVPVHLGERLGVVDARLHPLQELTESRERPVGDPPRLRLEERRLDEEPQGVDLLARAQRGGGDDDAVVRRRDDEAVALQPAERVAERGAADSERLHQPGVREPLTGRIRPVDDQVAEADVGVLCRVARAEQRARQSAPSPWAHRRALRRRLPSGSTSLTPRRACASLERGR